MTRWSECHEGRGLCRKTGGKSFEAAVENQADACFTSWS